MPRPRIETGRSELKITLPLPRARAFKAAIHDPIRDRAQYGKAGNIIAGLPRAGRPDTRLPHTRPGKPPISPSEAEGPAPRDPTTFTPECGTAHGLPDDRPVQTCVHHRKPSARSARPLLCWQFGNCAARMTDCPVCRPSPGEPIQQPAPPGSEPHTRHRIPRPGTSKTLPLPARPGALRRGWSPYRGVSRMAHCRRRVSLLRPRDRHGAVRLRLVRGAA